MWIQDVSRIVDRPNISHIPMISWPLVRRVIWPETNPLIPEPLSQQIRYLMNHGIAMCLPKPEDQPYLLLVPTNTVHTQAIRKKNMPVQRGSANSKQKYVCPWPQNVQLLQPFSQRLKEAPL
ncbi:unnamed protein product [Echinostoma caproni]|uniref:Uncharacterized protein n=1 Tax=Echinostoma caproni TaxID=27848 RepID=A0A3P8IC71_9TREM|nr:unnamed protein product [Echinostoma caproni]